MEQSSSIAVPHVGLSNQGATCYLNSLLQTLFHLKPFRHIVYSMPAPTEAAVGRSMVLEMQRLFYQMEFPQDSAAALSTQALTTSFGWNGNDVFMQHDIQEMNRILCDRLDECTKGTGAEGAIPNLFRGVVVNYLQCLDVEFSSQREEPFFDLSLNVKGAQDIYHSFRQYVQEEMLLGDNMYLADEHGLQRARKGTAFLKFPPVLFVQLKRFEYDFATDAHMKINDKYVFYPELDLSPFLKQPGSAPSPSPRAPDTTYDLYAVLVHRGDVTGGHYIAFIRPCMDDPQWFKFDDGNVTRVPIQEAVDAHFGSAPDMYHYYVHDRHRDTGPQGISANAYLLVYIQRTKVKQLMTYQLPDPLVQRLHNAFKKPDVSRPSPGLSGDLFMEVRVATTESARPCSINNLDPLNCFHNNAEIHHPNKNTTPSQIHAKSMTSSQRQNAIPSAQKKNQPNATDLIQDLPSSFHFRVLKTSCLADLIEDISIVTGIPSEQQQFWACHHGPDAGMLRLTEALSSPQLYEALFTLSNRAPVFNLWLQATEDPFPSTQKLLLFIEHFQSHPNPCLSLVGTLLLDPEQTTLTDLRQLCIERFLPNANDGFRISMYPERCSTKVVPLEISHLTTLRLAHFDVGDVIIIEDTLDRTPTHSKHQKPKKQTSTRRSTQNTTSLASPTVSSGQSWTASSWIEFIRNRSLVVLDALPCFIAPELIQSSSSSSSLSSSCSLRLELSRVITFSEFAQLVADHLKVLPDDIILFRGSGKSIDPPVFPLLPLTASTHPTLKHLTNNLPYPCETHFFYFVATHLSQPISVLRHMLIHTMLGSPLILCRSQQDTLGDILHHLLLDQASSPLHHRFKVHPPRGVLCEIYFHRIVRYLDSTMPLSRLDPRRIVYFLPQDALSHLNQVIRVQFVHFETLYASRPTTPNEVQIISLHGIPFFLDVPPDVLLGNVVHRVLTYLQKYAHYSINDFGTWKWAKLSPLSDYTTVERYFSDQSELISDQMIIGLEHPSPNSQSSHMTPSISISS